MSSKPACSEKSTTKIMNRIKVIFRAHVATMTGDVDTDITEYGAGNIHVYRVDDVRGDDDLRRRR